jgi:hypothetical protein
VTLEKSSNVIENFLLTLSAWQHKFAMSRVIAFDESELAKPKGEEHSMAHKTDASSF